MRRSRREADPPLTVEVIDRIEQLRVGLGWSRENLAHKSGISVRRIQDWLGAPGRRAAASGNPLRPRLQNIQCVAEALGLTSDELWRTTPVPPSITSRPTAADFESLARVAREVDDQLIDITRRLSGERLCLIRTAYQSLLHDQLRRRGFTLERWIELLTTRSVLTSIVNSLPHSGLDIVVTPNFERLCFRLPDGNELIVDRPNLLWDCACKTPDSRHGPDRCPIHKERELGEAITSAFNNNSVVIHWRGCQVRWSNVRDLWPPSIDSFTFLMDLYEADLIGPDMHSVLDLGSGTGFLGIALLEHHRQIKNVTLADWLLTPSLYGAVNWALNRSGHEHVELSLRIGMFSDWMIESPTATLDDVVLCNPPYLPILPGFEKFGVHAVVAGTELLNHVIENASSLGKKVFVQFSRLAMRDVEDAASRNRIRLKAITPQPRLVPFRVQRAWSEIPAYFEALRSLKDGLKVRPRNRHPYWHAIQSFEVLPHDR